MRVRHCARADAWAQTFAEVDQYQVLISNLKDAGFLPMDDDPRHSDDIAKAGKMKLLKQTVDGNEWQKYYFVMVCRPACQPLPRPVPHPDG